MLYPVVFSPILKEIIWGGDEICKFKDMTPLRNGIGESWEVSQVAGNVSVVANGELAGLSLDDLISQYGAEFLGKKVLDRFGTEFPLLIKFIDARDALSIQVHPDDELARKRHSSFGKTEMWYVINATPGAFLYSGFSKQITPEEYVESVANNTFVDTLQKHEVQPGDVFFLPAGRVHAIGAGCFIAEIQQSSNITYRIYDYNRRDAQGNPRELHTELAKDAIDYKVYPDYKLNYQPGSEHQQLVDCPYFTTNLIEAPAGDSLQLSTDDSFSIYICMQGKLRLTDSEGRFLELKQGQTALVPAACKQITLSVTEDCKVLETYIA